MMKQLVVIANKYPNEIEPNVNVFTQQVTWSIADEEVECIVICPMPINYNAKYAKLPYRAIEKTGLGTEVVVYRPKYFGLGIQGEALQKQRVSITTKLFTNAVEQVLKEIGISNSVLLAEFMCPTAVCASYLGKKYGIRSYMQYGTALYYGNEFYGNERLAKLLENLDGVIALSGYNKLHLTENKVIPEEKIIILPSGYRKDRIYKRDKVEARKKLGLPLNNFIVGFCGSFDDRKGILRLEKAIDGITDNNVVLAACGKGKCAPKSKKLVWNGPINHEDLAWFYSALDVFAFPTYYEGCCTAIVEAMACGCPIISSDRSFNYEICDESNSILIEPDDISAMRKAILTLKNDENIQISMSKASLRKSKDLSLDKKATKMIEFMNLK